MSGAEVLAIIGVLGPLLSGSAVLVRQIRDRRKKWREDEKALSQKFLAQSLEAGELKIRSTYERYVRQFGDQFRQGDEISRQRIQQHILEAENVKRVIQLAWEQNKDIQDIQAQWESAAAISREAKQTMEELGLRLMGVNGQASHPTPDLYSSPVRNSGNFATLSSATLANSPPTTPSTYTQPHPRKQGSAVTPPPSSPQPDRSLSPRALFTKRFYSSPAAVTNDRPEPTGERRGSIYSVNSIKTTASQGSKTSLASDMSPKPFQGGSISRNGPRSPLVGRPDRSNKFHGFCQGAWSIQTSTKGGMELIHVPNGLAGNLMLIQCRKCRFRGEPFGPNKKHWTCDERIRKASCGVQYRYLFLAKSHQTCKDYFQPGEKVNTKMDAQNFGCIFCWAEGVYTDSFGGVDTLMHHILVEHGKGIREDTQRRTNCIVGRVADVHEDFDINIPPTISSTNSEYEVAASATADTVPWVGKEIEESLLDLELNDCNDDLRPQIPVLDFTHGGPSTLQELSPFNTFLPPELDGKMIPRS